MWQFGEWRCLQHRMFPVLLLNRLDRHPKLLTDCFHHAHDGIRSFKVSCPGLNRLDCFLRDFIEVMNQCFQGGRGFGN